MKFKVGQKVRIIKNIPLTFAPIKWVREMDRTCNQEGIVTSIGVYEGVSYYDIQIKDDAWLYIEEWVTAYEPIKPKQFGIAIFCKSIYK